MENENSVFDNIPERPKLEEPTVESVQISKEANRWIYSIMDGASDDEYYTFIQPVIVQDQGVVISDAFKKGVVSQTVLNITIEEYYKTPPIIGDTNFDLREGVLIKQFDVNSIPWLKQDIETAKNNLKDQVINKYQAVVPDLMNRLGAMETKIKNNKSQRDYDDELIGL